MNKSIENDDLKRFLRYTSESKLFLLRNVSVGAAGISLAIILVILQVGVKGVFLEVSLTTAAIGMPLWMALASLFEFYIFYGKSSYPHLRTNFTIVIMALLLLPGTLCLVASITSLIWHLSIFAVKCFGVSVAVVVVLDYLQRNNVKHFLQQKKVDEVIDV